jgi:hypothetical protein
MTWVGWLFFCLVLGWLVGAWSWNKAYDVRNISKLADEICLTAFGEHLPKHTVAYVRNSPGLHTLQHLHDDGLHTTLGYYHKGTRSICIFRDAHVQCGADELDTLVHECVHALWPDMRHGTAFDAKVEEGMYNLWRIAADGNGTTSWPCSAGRGRSQEIAGIVIDLRGEIR